MTKNSLDARSAGIIPGARVSVQRMYSMAVNNNHNQEYRVYYYGVMVTSKEEEIIGGELY